MNIKYYRVRKGVHPIAINNIVSFVNNRTRSKAGNKVRRVLTNSQFKECYIAVDMSMRAERRWNYETDRIDYTEVPRRNLIGVIVKSHHITYVWVAGGLSSTTLVTTKLLRLATITRIVDYDDCISRALDTVGYRASSRQRTLSNGIRPYVWSKTLREVYGHHIKPDGAIRTWGDMQISPPPGEGVDPAIPRGLRFTTDYTSNTI